MNLHLNFRSIAYRFSMFEHNFSRLLFLCLLMTYGFFYTGNYFYTNLCLITDIIVWLLYWVSHNFEKIFFRFSEEKHDTKKKTFKY